MTIRRRGSAGATSTLISRTILGAGLAAVLMAAPAGAQELPFVRNAAGMELRIVAEHASPTLRLVLPGQPATDRTIEVLFPEHVTGVRHGRTDPEHLYLWQPGARGDRPAWRRVGDALEYERELAGGVRLLARAVLEADGVRFHYAFQNRSAVAYDMMYAVTDPRLTGIFHDVRLERTWVHYRSGFALLAAETPERLTMPLSSWLPARYLAAFTWPVPDQRIEHRDGMTYYNTARAVDQPLIATVSTDGAWVVASLARNPGNVWSNPELTCQHVDPQTTVAAGASAATEVKILVWRGSLDDILVRAVRQRPTLK